MKRDLVLDQLNGNGSIFWQWVRQISTLLALLTMAFAAGMNYHKIDALGGQVEAHIQQTTRENATFVRKAEIDASLAGLHGQLHDLSTQVAALSKRIDAVMLRERRP